jgi:general secretion pathway protein D
MVMQKIKRQISPFTQQPNRLPNPLLRLDRPPLASLSLATIRVWSRPKAQPMNLSIAFVSFFLGAMVLGETATLAQTPMATIPQGMPTNNTNGNANGPLPGALNARSPLATANANTAANSANSANSGNNLAVEKTAQGLTLNFVNADIEAVAKTMASLTDKNLVVDPKVHGTLSLSTDKPVNATQAWGLFVSALRLQMFSVVEVNGLYKVLPEADAKLQGGSVSLSANAPVPGSTQVVTQIFRLEHESANNLLNVLRPLISPNNTINVSPNSNALVITDYGDNLQRLARIIATLDVTSASDVEVIPLKSAIAQDLAPLVSRLIESAVTTGPQVQGAPPSPESGGYKTTIIAEPRSNALILRAANPSRAAQARSLIEKLDRPSSESPAGNIHVVYLKNADATKLANTLRAAMQSNQMGAVPGALQNTAAPPPIQTQPGMNPNQATTGGQIQADTATNSLIITANDPQFRQMRAVIDQLDARRAQVMVESLIAEVDASKTSQFGIQWQNFLGSKGGNVGVVGTNFGAGGSNILTLGSSGTSGAVSPGAGLNIGSFRDVNGVYVLSALANFLQQDGGTNILSTPNLLTLDNEEAKIVVGQNVPFVTGQYSTANTNNGAVNPFQTIERKDVGLTLRVKPQISETGTVKLTIYQEVSSVDPTSVGSVSGLITNKRSIESNVLVEDGSIVVLGGLLSDEFDGNKSQVPGAGDMPFFGALFKSENRTRKKTNLMVFLRPVVLRDAQSTEVLSQGRYEQMMGQQRNAKIEPNFALPIEGDVSLPAGSFKTLTPAPSSPPIGTLAPLNAPAK